MEITAALVKELRERTGLGMMECKKALVEAQGDIEGAIKAMREAELVKAVKKAGRIAAEGVITIKASADKRRVAMLEVNSETDFVAKDENFRNFVAQLATVALDNATPTLEALLKAPMNGKTVEECRAELVARIGENISIRRVVLLTDDHPIATYLHGTRIGVLVVSEKTDEALAQDIAMHVAASKPEVVNADEVPVDRMNAEKEIFVAQAKESGKTGDIVEKMVAGRLKKFLADISLYGQAFVKDPDITVEKLLTSRGAAVKAFYRFEVGEGIEKKEENFRDEVMAQVKGS